MLKRPGDDAGATSSPASPKREPSPRFKSTQGRTTGALFTVSKFVNFSKRFYHHLFGHISGISKPPLYGCCQSFEPSKALFHILTAWL